MAVNETIERIVYEGVDKISSVAKSAADSQKTLRLAVDGVKSALASVGVTVGAGAMVALYLDTLKATAALDDMAEATGASVEGLSAIQRVAKVSGADFDGLTSQIGKMIKGLREGGEEGSKTAKALDFLGVKAKDVDGRFRDTSQVLIEVSQALGRYEDGGNKVALVQDILGKGAERYLPLLKDMAEGTDLLATVTTKQAAEAEKLEKNINRLGLAFSDTRRELVSGMTPAMIALTDRILEANKAGGLFLVTMRAAADLASRAGGLGPIGLVGRVAGAGIDAATRGAPPGGSQADVRRVENALEPPKQLTYQPPDEGAVARAQKDREFVAKQQEGLEEEQRIQTEAFHWTAFYADKRRETEKATADAIIQAKIDFYERDQELAIAQGEELLAADSTSHSLKLDMFRQSLLTEEELELEAHTKRLERLAEFSAAELEALGGHAAVKEQIEQDHQARLLQIRSRGLNTLAAFNKASFQQQAATVFGELEAITAGVAQHNQALFRINQVAGIANAVIAAHEGASKTLATYPWPLAGVLAAIHYAAGVARVAAIAGASYGGGGGAGSAPSIAGSTPATPVTPVQAAQVPAPPQITLTLAGAGRYSAEEIRELIVQINEQLRDGMRLQS